MVLWLHITALWSQVCNIHSCSGGSVYTTTEEIVLRGYRSLLQDNVRYMLETCDCAGRGGFVYTYAAGGASGSVLAKVVSDFLSTECNNAPSIAYMTGVEV